MYIYVYIYIYIHTPIETRGWGAAAPPAPPPQILAKVDLLPIDNNSEKLKRAKKYKPYQIPRKLLVTLLLFT